MSISTAENIPSFINARHRRLLHGTRRRRLRGSLAARSSIGVRSTSTKGSVNHNNNATNTNNNNINRQQQQQHIRWNSNIPVRHPMISDDRWRRTLRKRRRQRAIQMKLDGNQLSQQAKSSRPRSEHTYNEIKQSIPLNNEVNANIHNASAGGVLERAVQFNGALRDRVFSWYRGANNNGRDQSQPQESQPQPRRDETIQQVFSTSENGESEQKVSY